VAHLVVSQSRVPTRVQGVPDQATATPTEPQTHIVFTLTIGVISGDRLLFGLWFRLDVASTIRSPMMVASGDPKPWQPEAVTVASDRLVFKPRLAPVS
jgi:hypothetical protein